MSSDGLYGAAKTRVEAALGSVENAKAKSTVARVPPSQPATLATNVGSTNTFRRTVSRGIRIEVSAESCAKAPTLRAPPRKRTIGPNAPPIVTKSDSRKKGSGQPRPPPSSRFHSRPETTAMLRKFLVWPRSTERTSAFVGGGGFPDAAASRFALPMPKSMKICGLKTIACIAFNT